MATGHTRIGARKELWNPLDEGVAIYEYLRAFNEYGGRPVYPSHLLSAKTAFTLADERLDALEEAVDRLNRAQVSVYGIRRQGSRSGNVIVRQEPSGLIATYRTGIGRL